VYLLPDGKVSICEPINNGGGGSDIGDPGPIIISPWRPVNPFAG
jgi:hypothetical protein